MVRFTPMVLFGTVSVCAAVGCAHFVEMQAINHFTAALETSDLDKLKASASGSFDDKALRRDKDSLEALKTLPLHADEKITIVKVEDVSKTKKKVVVTTAKTHRKMQYNLVRDEKASKWVVDDIIVRQNRKDVAAAKSVTEQMDLLLTVQDFLISWNKGKRDEVQKVTTVAFGKLLADLPESHLQRLTKKVAGEKLKPHEFRPEATIDGNDAVVKLTRAKGVLVLTMQQTKKGWKVADAAIESRKDKDQLTSARRTATAIHTVVKFLQAYQADDKKSLQVVTASRLFDNCLNVADLKTVPLPAPDSMGDKDVVKTHDKGGEYVMQFGKNTVKVSLLSPSAKLDENTAVPYTVDDVTFYDAREERRLSAVFTAQAKLQLFMNAVTKSNMLLIRKNSTKDLNYKVWSRLGAVTLAEILPPEIELTTPVITGSDYHGAVTNIYVKQGSRELTYVMRDYSGDVTVDDILMPVMDRPSSLKETMQSLLPIRLFIAGLRDAAAADANGRQLTLLSAVTSGDFNRRVWSQINQVPEVAFTVLSRLDMPLATIADTPTGQTVVLGDERFGAKIEMVREKDFLVIDNLWMMAGAQGDPRELKRLLVSQLVRRGGPRSVALDPMSAHPIATEPTKTAEATAADADRDTLPTGKVTPASALMPTGTLTHEDPVDLKKIPDRGTTSPLPAAGGLR